VPIDAPRNIDSGDRLFVRFSEGVMWIAHRSLGGPPPIGPRPLSDLPLEDTNESLVETGKLLLAEQLLLDFGAKGRIRILSLEWEGIDEEPDMAEVQIPAEFLSRATLQRHSGEGYQIFIPRKECYYNLVVDYHDLTEVFWGATTSSSSIQAEFSVQAGFTAKGGLTAGVPSVKRSRSARRRGRPEGYPWGDFNAELVRRCLSGPVRSQGELENHMLQWCTDHWPDEPVVSVIRDRVGPTFKMLERRKLEAEGLPLAEPAGNSAEQFSAAPAGHVVADDDLD
jgi:hypothetical protein